MEPKPPIDKSEAVPLLAQSDQLAGEPLKNIIILPKQGGVDRAEDNVDGAAVASSAKQFQEVEQYLQKKESDVDTALNSGKAAVAVRRSESFNEMTQYGNATPDQTLDGQKAVDYGQGQAGRRMEATAPTTPSTTAAENTIDIGVEGDEGPDAQAADGHHDYKGPKIWRIIVQHWPFISQPLALVAIAIGLWIIAYVLLPEYTLPHMPIMRIFFLFVGAQLSGVLVTFLRLPDMLGMLFFGVLYTNVGLADFTGYDKFEAFLREMALINIMLLAGLGLDASAFKKLWLMILRLTLVPTIAEVTIITLVARFTLDMPWFWGILLGLVITAVSPNVVVTVMLKLKEERLGLNSGIHTLIYAMTSCNDVVAIFLFGVFMSVIFSTDKSLTEQILQGPIGIGIGIVFGYVYGLMLTILPSTKTAYLNGLRFVLTILGGTIAVMGSRAIGYPSAGVLGCMTIAFFAGIGWKRQQRQLTAQQRQRQLENENFRLVFAYLSTYGGNLTRKERAYITISGFPKATVQAALGPLALDMARSLKTVDEQSLALANNVLIISVLAIIFTAPLGAVLMLRLAPHWLQRSESAAGGSNNNIDGNVNGNEYKKKRLSDGSSLGDAVNYTQKVAQSLSGARGKTEHNSSNSLNVMAAVDESSAVGKETRIDVGATSVARTPLPVAKTPQHLV
ncbi:sodium/hydrogen exchanger 9B2 isoform X4 [Bactrocera dorsalis]|uniref:Sodium/hydrogen exchanger 9B2 isoform X4 n=1 Tax=Bactrocera dorsalis TaxID=27457 RepID=A0ABM3J8R9_BACDO|nr:sodium/hydrogen exchanger 9B2 isoform X4 [Bactrocera dorsalis]